MFVKTCALQGVEILKGQHDVNGNDFYDEVDDDDDDVGDDGEEDDNEDKEV